VDFEDGCGNPQMEASLQADLTEKMQKYTMMNTNRLNCCVNYLLPQSDRFWRHSNICELRPRPEFGCTLKMERK